MSNVADRALPYPEPRQSGVSVFAPHDLASWGRKVGPENDSEKRRCEPEGREVGAALPYSHHSGSDSLGASDVSAELYSPTTQGRGDLGMDQRTKSATLVIGWGNDLLGDDAAGRCVAREVAARNRPDVEALDVHQLTPELALYIAKAKTVIFVDADAAAEQDAIRMERIFPAHTADRAAAGHTGRPEDLLAMAESLYGMRPEAWLIAVPARSFEPGEALSGITRTGIRDAVDAIEKHLNDNHLKGRTV